MIYSLIIRYQKLQKDGKGLVPAIPKYLLFLAIDRSVSSF